MPIASHLKAPPAVNLTARQNLRKSIAAFWGHWSMHVPNLGAMIGRLPVCGSEATDRAQVDMQKDLLPLKDVVSLMFLRRAKEWPSRGTLSIYGS